MSWWQELLGRLRREGVRINFSDDYEEPNNNVEKYTRQWFETHNVTIPVNCESGSNGINLCGHSIPEEMLCLVLSRVGIKDLLHCRMVCHRWKSIVDSQIWMLKLNKNIYKSLQKLNDDFEIPFSVFYKIYRNDAFNRNLIKNPSGEEGLNYWVIRANGGDHWVVEKPPIGSCPLLEESNSCFVTSFAICSKEQIVDLAKEGLLPIIMDEIRPTIYVCEMYARRFDCISTYQVEVMLMDRRYRQVETFSMQKTELDDQWQKVEHCFQNYPPGVRYIKFTHSGKDSQFWKGHYGSKMSQACVKVTV